MDPLRTSSEPIPGTSTEPGQDAVDAWYFLAFCPNCSAKLQNIKCKARCPRCGFFQDCGDTIV